MPDAVNINKHKNLNELAQEQFVFANAAIQQRRFLPGGLHGDSGAQAPSVLWLLHPQALVSSASF